MAARASGRAYDAALSEVGLNSAQYAILVNIARSQPIRNMELAERLEMDRTTLYRATAILAKRGLLASAPAEGKDKLLSLTGKGDALTKAARARWEAVQSRFIDRFGADRWTALMATLDEVRAHFRA